MWSRGGPYDPRSLNPTPRSLHGVDISSLVADLAPKYHCNLDCKWATNKPSCIRSAESLEAYFKEHGRFNIVRSEYVDKYSECPLYELKGANP